MQVAGPGLGGLLAQLVSAAAGLVLDAVSFSSPRSAWPGSGRRHPAPTRKPVESLGRQIRAGVDFLRRDRYLRWFVVLGSVSNFGLIGYSAVLVLHLVRELGLSPTGVGIVLAVGSAGGLVGAALAPYVSLRFGSGAPASPCWYWAGRPPCWWRSASQGGVRVWCRSACSWLGFSWWRATSSAAPGSSATYRPRSSPRVVTTHQVVAYAAMPLAGLVAGWLGSVLGIRSTIAVMATVYLLASLAILLSPFRRLHDLRNRNDVTPAAR